MLTVADTMSSWAEPAPELGPAVYRLSTGPREHKHSYHTFCPWSPDGSLLLCLRFTRDNPVAELCTIDMTSGEPQVVARIGTPRVWNSHCIAFQQWLGDTGRILYMTDHEGAAIPATIRPNGTDRRLLTEAGPREVGLFGSGDGRWIYYASGYDELFPDDEIAPRHDKGLWRLNAESGETELVCSIEQALDLVPDREKAAACHMFIKMYIPHRTRSRVLFNFVNDMWDRRGQEPRLRHLITIDGDGSNGAYLGQILHHPNWHPSADQVIANVKDINGETRFGLFQGDGQRLLDYVPMTNGSGHPTISPDGKWIFADGNGPRGTQLIFCSPADGRKIIAADFDQVSDGYAAYKAVDEGSGKVVDALEKGVEMRAHNWQTQGHPAWSRDGSTILFNADRGEGSQVYAIDVEQTLARGAG